MRCTSCHRNIAAGAEAQKMVVEYQQPDGSVKVHGYQMPDGPLAGAKGVLKAGWHSKAQPLDEPVFVPGGWVKMGELKIGDEIISPGSIHSCVSAIIPRGVQAVYEVVFADGGTTRASAGHLWQMNDGSVITTMELRAAQQQGLFPVALGRVDLGPDPTLGPYLLGALLGDGGLRGSTPTLVSMDEEVVDQAIAELPQGMQVRIDPISGSARARCWNFVGGRSPHRAANPLTRQLRELGLWGIRSQDRFIPRAALYASYPYRLRLLQGLLDTDGAVSQSGQVTFSSKSRTLVEDVRELALSLGGMLRTVRAYPSSYRDRSGAIRECGMHYATTIHLPNDVVPVSLRRKAERLPIRRHPHRRSVVAVREVEPAEVMCIAVSGPSRLYVTRDWIVTHNCWHVNRKREAKGDAVSGRIISGAPTGYEVDQLVLNREDLEALGLTIEQARERSTAHLSERVTRLRDLAKTIGKGVGDPQVYEAFAAQERGGPYPHQHHHAMELYQLIAHLEYAHGLVDVMRTPGGLVQRHTALHAQARVQADRHHDAEPDVVVRDWRTQFTAEII